jgi:hypothetical protein
VDVLPVLGDQGTALPYLGPDLEGVLSTQILDENFHPVALLYSRPPRVVA